MEYKRSGFGSSFLSITCFRTGNGRLSEQSALTSHVVFLKLHKTAEVIFFATNLFTVFQYINIFLMGCLIEHQIIKIKFAILL